MIFNLIFLALSANFKDESVSSWEVGSAEQLIIIDVLNFPDRESLSILVSLESLKGMC